MSHLEPDTTDYEAMAERAHLSTVQAIGAISQIALEAIKRIGDAHGGSQIARAPVIQNASRVPTDEELESYLAQ